MKTIMVLVIFLSVIAFGQNKEIEKLNNMSLHQTIIIASVKITKVPGGYIYTQFTWIEVGDAVRGWKRVPSQYLTSVFVPDGKVYKRTK